MLKIENLKIKWSYEDRITYCRIYEANELIVAASAQCSVDDTRVKDKGRKISLSRALQLYTSDKNLRSRVWEAYRTMPLKNKRW